MNRRSLAVVALAATTAALFSACSVGLDDNDAEQARVTTSARLLGQSEKDSRATTLTPAAVAPTGEARIDGTTRGSLTADTVSRYNTLGAAADVSVANNGAEAGFASLCRGRIDMVDSARPISPRELQLCRRYGLQPVQFQFASDAVVLAIKSETDIGGDCLSVGQVDDLYRAGSQIVNWSDLGFDNVPVAVGGPDRKNNAFDFFGRNVLGAPEPSMTYLRSDYRAFPDDAATRAFVVGDASARQYATLADYYSQLSTAQHAALVQARRNVDSAKANAKGAARERQKGIVDGRPEATQAKDQARLVAAKAALRTARLASAAAAAQDAALRNPATRAEAAEKTLAALRGHVAFFRFTYYELFEDDLRPFEITPTKGARNCVFPSQATITSGQYPLARRLLVTTTTRSLARREVQDFLLHYLTSAQQDAVDARLVPIPDAVLAAQKAWVQGTTPPVVVTARDVAEDPSVPEPAR